LRADVSLGAVRTKANGLRANDARGYSDDILDVGRSPARSPPALRWWKSAPRGGWLCDVQSRRRLLPLLNRAREVPSGARGSS